jgi:endonuclease-8
MPEGDTVWNTARALERVLVGRELTGSDFRVPRLATTDLTGWTVTQSASRGKHLLLRLTKPAQSSAAGVADAGRRPAPASAYLTLHSHLRMDGSWRTFPASTRWTGGPAHTIRVVLRTADTVAVGYHLHDVALVPTDREDTLVGHLGPDLLGDDWDPAEAVRRLESHLDTPVAEALLDQGNLAGIGNLYVCEVLYLRGIWPWTPVREVPDLPAVVTLAQRLLASNLGRWTQATTGSTRPGESNYVYGRAGRPCRRCGTLIKRGEQGPPGQERLRYWCPTCQPEPTR